MPALRTLIVGAGSIGSRRARLLAEMGHEVSIFDVDVGMAAEVALTTGNVVGQGVALDAAPSDGIRPGGSVPMDAVFICSPAASHVQMAHEALRVCHPRGLFIEKPLSVSMDGIPELIAECEARGVVTMGACNVRWGYRALGSPLGLLPYQGTSEFGVFAPLSSWRTGAEGAYKTNGVVLEMAIHELDIAATVCGPIDQIYGAWSPDGTDDSCQIALHHTTKRTSYVVASWKEGVRPERWLTTNAGPNAVEYHADPSDEQYRQEMAHFLDHVASGTATTNTIANAAETLRWALKARDMTRSVAA